MDLRLWLQVLTFQTVHRMAPSFMSDCPAVVVIVAAIPLLWLQTIKLLWPDKPAIALSLGGIEMADLSLRFF